MASKVYNARTWFWHKFLHAPIRLQVAFDNKVKRPDATVIFLHGISATSATWNSTLKQIGKDPDLKNVRLVALDLLGFGKSLHADWLKYNYTEYAKALHRALRKTHPRGKVILIGHSMGSLIAADYIVNYESPIHIDRLILVSAPVLMSDELAKLPDQIYTKSFNSLHRIVREVPAAETVGKLAQRFTSFRSDYINTTATHQSMDNIILNRQNYDTIAKIHLPTLLIHGHFDPLVIGANLKRAAAHNPRYLKYISVIGQHDVSVGKRAKIITEIKKVLKES